MLRIRDAIQVLDQSEPGRLEHVGRVGRVRAVSARDRPDDKAADLMMLALHHRLHAGASLADALRDARADLGSDPLQTATGWSFIALGAG
jgi:hypothetical protein